MLFACTTEFDSTSGYKDITIVYGLLDQSDSVTFLKINKAFLGDGDVMLMAKEEDSSSYGNALDVKIHYKKGNFLDSVTFDTTTIYNKDSGVFYAPKQVLYKANMKTILNQYKTDTFKLVITNKKTGKTIHSKTILESSFEITKPKPPSIGFTSAVPGSIVWKSSVNGKKHQVLMRFHYKEVKPGTTDTVYHSIDWQFPTTSSVGNIGGEVMTQQYTNAYFFDLLAQKIPVDASLKRYIGQKGHSTADYGALELFVYVASDEFSTYLDVAAPSTSLVQEKPDYTNVTNASGAITQDATGIFSSRYHELRSFKLNDLTQAQIKSMNLGF